MAASRDRALLRAARALSVDRVTAEVTRALSAAGIESIVMKGPAIARWLYPSGGRTYIDTDLLVRCEDFDRAGKVLERSGYASRFDGWSPVETDRQPESTPYVRDNGAGKPRDLVDLHHNLPGLRVPSAVVWQAFKEHSETIDVAGTAVQVPSRRCTALHIVLHAVQHGFEGQTAEDLRRVVAELPAEQWREVRDVAERFEVLDVLVVGLGRAGGDIRPAGLLGLAPLEAAHSRASHWWTAPAGGQALASFWDAQSRAERSQRLRSAVLPSPSKVRRTSELDLGRQPMLAGAYAHWWWKVARSVVPAARFARRHRRLADHRGPAEQLSDAGGPLR